MVVGLLLGRRGGAGAETDAGKNHDGQQ